MPDCNPMTDPAVVRCKIPYTDWQGITWTCHLPQGHVGDHYSLDHDTWCWYGKGN